MRMPINYTVFHCDVCNIDHFQYWIDGDECNLKEEEVHDLLNSGHYFLKPVIPINNIK